MITSMTGFGRGSAAGGDNAVTVEISAVNSRKGLDLRFALPREFAWLEPQLAKRIRGTVSRGCLNVTVSYDLDAEHRLNRVRIDPDLARHAARVLADIAQNAGIDPELRAADLLLIPGVVVEQPPALPDDIDDLVTQALDTALTELRQMQTAEGRTLQRDLAARQTALQALLATIRAGADVVLTQWRDKLRDRIAALGVELELDDERLAKEVAFYAERSDITEEIVRLDSHLTRFGELLNADERTGRVLEFLCQELGREISTVCAKSADTRISAPALAFKTELAKVREQIQNVE